MIDINIVKFCIAFNIIINIVSITSSILLCIHNIVFSLILLLFSQLPDFIITFFICYEVLNKNDNDKEVISKLSSINYFLVATQIILLIVLFFSYMNNMIIWTILVFLICFKIGSLLSIYTISSNTTTYKPIDEKVPFIDIEEGNIKSKYDMKYDLLNIK